MTRPFHFEICTTDLDGLTTFYRDALGWSWNSMAPGIPYRLATTGGSDAPGINGAAMPDFQGFTGVVLTMHTDDVEAAVKRVVDGGGAVVKPRHAVPHVGWQAYVKDPQGNLFGLHCPDPKAA